MPNLKPFELPTFYRFLVAQEDRRQLTFIVRLIWFSVVFISLYVETHLQVSLFTPEQLNGAWRWILAWALVAFVLTLLRYAWVPLVLLVFDGLTLGAMVGATGLTYSIVLLPWMLYVISIIFLESWQWTIVLLACVVTGMAIGSYGLPVFDEHLLRVDWMWLGGGGSIIVAVSVFLVSSLRRHGVQIIHDHMYQKWLEQLNTIIFDLMPAGALVCDELGRIQRANPVIEPYVRSLIHRNGSVLELDPIWSKNQVVQSLMDTEEGAMIRLSTLDQPDGRLFRVVFKPLVIHSEPKDALYLLLLYDVTELQRRQEEEEISRRWKSFQNISAGLVHEIRNPLGAILGVIESVLGSDEMRPADKEKMLSMVRYEGQRMNTLVQDFLDSLQTHMVINAERCDVKRVCEDFYQLVSKDPAVKSKNVYIEFRHRLKGSAVIEADKDRLLQVLHNLFRNALYAVTTGGGDSSAGIILELDDQPGWIVIRCIDHGPGIPKEIMPRILDPFFTTKEKGTGLGLSISYRIIDAHGGKLRFLSHPGRPTRVEVWLPRSN